MKAGVCCASDNARASRQEKSTDCTLLTFFLGSQAGDGWKSKRGRVCRPLPKKALESEGKGISRGSRAAGSVGMGSHAASVLKYGPRPVLPGHGKASKSGGRAQRFLAMKA